MKHENANLHFILQIFALCSEEKVSRIAIKSGMQYAGRGLTTPLRGRGSLRENQFQSVTEH